MSDPKHFEEIDIAKNLPKSIEENDLMSRDIPSLDRILEIYFAKANRKISDEKEIINFLFKFIDLHGKKGSVLFRHLDKSQERDDVIRCLYENYKNKFDFDCVHSSLFESAYEAIHVKQNFKYLLICSIVALFLSIFIIKIENNKKYEALTSQLNEKIQKLDETTEQLNNKIQKLDETTEQLNNKIQKLDETTEQLNNKIQKLDKTTEQLNYRIQKGKDMSKKRFIGELFYSTRIEDRLPGALKCNGQSVNVLDYLEFTEKYLETKLVATIPIDEWRKMKKSNNNVGFFGYDLNGSVFITPFIPSGTFLSNANTDLVNGNHAFQGNYTKDQIVNIKGSTTFKMVGINWDPHSNSGALFSSNVNHWSLNAKCNGQDDDWDRAHKIDFDASKSVTTGDRVMPRTIYYNLFVIVSDID